MVTVDNIAVTVKEVAHVSEDVQIEGNEIEETYLTYTISECDEYALEAGIQLSEELNAKITTVTMAPFHASDVVRSCLARGANHSIRVWDETLRNIGPQTKGQVLAETIKSINPDLLLMGAEAEDDQYGCTNTIVARKLDLPYTNRVIEIEEVEEQIKVQRELEGGLREKVEISTPAAISIQPGIHERRYVPVSAIRKVDKEDWESHDIQNFGIDEINSIATDGELVKIRAVERGQAEILNEDKSIEDAIDELANMIRLD